MHNQHALVPDSLGRPFSLLCFWKLRRTLHLALLQTEKIGFSGRWFVTGGPGQEEGYSVWDCSLGVLDCGSFKSMPEHAYILQTYSLIFLRSSKRIHIPDCPKAHSAPAQ